MKPNWWHIENFIIDLNHVVAATTYHKSSNPNIAEGIVFIIKNGTEVKTPVMSDSTANKKINEVVNFLKAEKNLNPPKNP